MNSKTKRITVIGMLCAITYVTMVVGRIPIILFLKYDPSDVIVTLGGFIWGADDFLHCICYCSNP